MRRLSSYATPARSMQGLTLIEMMIAMALGLLLIAGVGYAYIGSRQTSRQQDALSRIQEGARFAFETMGVDVRMAGYTGCMPGVPINALTPASRAYWYGQPYDVKGKDTAGVDLGNGLPLQGYENAAATAPNSAAEGNVRANVYTGGGVQPDALAVLRADNAQQYVVSAYDAASKKFTLTTAPNLSVGDIVVATDCTNTLISQATNVAGTAVTALGAATTYPQNSLLFPLSGNLYYIRANASGQPSLYRQPVPGAAVPPPEELVEGVEDMQISYGVDTSADCTILANGAVTSDHVIDTYVTADNVQATVPCDTPQKDWQRVLSVKVSLLLRSTEDNITTQAQTYTFNGVQTTAADRRLRKVFTTVFAVRNRL